MIALLIGLSGCASQSEALHSAMEKAPGGAELDVSSNQLRVDIIPGESTPWLDKQSWIADADTDWGNLEIDILASIRVSGRVTGYSPTPFGAEVPGSGQTPVEATVALVREGTISGASVATDEDGNFALYVPPARGYTMSIVPHDGQHLPFMVTTNADFETVTDLGELDLGYGEPVHGAILDASGTPISGARVHLQDLVTGTEGASVLSNAEGRYVLRASPGDYAVVAQGQSGRAIPRIAQDIEVRDDTSVRVDFDMGDLSVTPVYGQVIDEASGQAIRDVGIRFSSDSLDSIDGTLEIETETDGDGIFNRSLLPGTWVAQFIPEYDSTLAPSEIVFDVTENGSGIDLEQIELPPRIEFRSVAIDDLDQPVAGAAVNARELGFDGYIHSTTTDMTGRFELLLPPSPVSLMVAPPGEDLAVTNVFVDPAGEAGSVLVSRGQRVEGQISSVGAGVGFALVEIRDISGLLYATALTDPNGQFQLRMEAF